MRLPFVSTVFACALSAFEASASMPTAGSTLIVQQRTADGRILLTDRPVPGATTERSWTVPGATAERSWMVPGASFSTPTDRSEGNEQPSGVPRHIDAQWRPLGEDPGRDRVVRLTLERERLHRLSHRPSPSPRDPMLRGSAGAGLR